MMQTKEDIRIEMKKRRQELSEQEAAEKSRKICEDIVALPIYKQTEVLYLYSAIQKEVNLSFLLETAWEQGKITAFPKVTGQGEEKEMKFYRISSYSELSSGFRGILEPTAEEVVEADGLLIVPGLAFDLEKNRIGYGGGFYDKYIQRRRQQQKEDYIIGVCYERQMTALLPKEDTDRKVQTIITEVRTYV